MCSHTRPTNKHLAKYYTASVLVPAAINASRSINAEIIFIHITLKTKINNNNKSDLETLDKSAHVSRHFSFSAF